MTTDRIIGGTTPDNVRYLKLFLQDYSKMFNVNNLNARCNNCIKDYHKKYIQKMGAKDNGCGWRLHDKYNGIQIDSTSSVHINNANITEELALALFEKKGATIFAKMPQTIVEPTTDAPKLKRTRRTKKQ
jgi:hypothetical protein